MKFTLLSLLVVFSPGLVTNVDASNAKPWTEKGKESAIGTRDIRSFFANAAAAQPPPAPAPTQSLESEGSESSSDDGSDSSSDEEENERAPPPAIPSASVRARAPRVSDSSAASLPVIHHHLPPFAENESSEDEELSNGESSGRAARISLDFNDEVSSRIRSASDADLNNRVENIIRHRGLSHDTDEEATSGDGGSGLFAAGGGLLSSEESLSSSHAPGDGLVGATIPDRGETSSLFQDAESSHTRSPLEQPLRDYIEYDENDDFSDVFSVPEFIDSGEINLQAGFEETSWEQIDTGNVYINPAFSCTLATNKTGSSLGNVSSSV